jgi:hypothetical protein
VRVRLSLLGLLLCDVALSAQQSNVPAAPDVPVFRTSTDLVTVDAVVTDSDGRHVTDLTREGQDGRWHHAAAEWSDAVASALSRRSPPRPN